MSDRAGERPGGRARSRRWLLVTIALGVGVPRQPAARVPRRSTSAPTATPTAASTYLLTGLHGAPRHGRHLRDGPAVRAARAQPRPRIAWRRGRVASRCSGTSSTSSGCSCSRRSGSSSEVARWPSRPSRRRSSASLSFGAVGGSAAPAAAAAGRRRRRSTLAQCAACHGADGTGVEDRGPALTDEGAAAADFVLRTGRMPMAAPAHGGRAGPTRFTEEQIVALVDHVGAFGDGPAIPDVDPTRGDLAGGARLYQLNCAACHVASGRGRRDRRRAQRARPDGGDADRDRRGDPRRSRRDAGVRRPSATRTSTTSRPTSCNCRASDTTAPDDFGGAGPVAEGLAAWLLALLPLDRPDPLDRHAPTRAATRRSTRRRRHRDRAHRASSPAQRPGLPSGRRLVRRSPSPAASPRRSATAPTTPATCSGSASPRRCSASGSGSCAGPSTSTSTSTRCRSASRSSSTPAATAELHEELRRPARCSAGASCSLGLLGVSFVSLVVGFVGPIGSLGPKPRGERARTAWRAGSRLVTLDGTPIELAGTDVRPARHGVPRGPHRRGRLPGRAAAHAARAADAAHDRRRRPRGLGRLLQDLHPRRLLGRPVRRRQPAARHAAPARVPVPPVGVRSGRRRPAGRRPGDAVAAAAALDVDADGFLVAKAPFDRVVGPLAWNEA